MRASDDWDHHHPSSRRAACPVLRAPSSPGTLTRRPRSFRCRFERLAVERLQALSQFVDGLRVPGRLGARCGYLTKEVRGGFPGEGARGVAG
jgi:hypothetical protein